MSSLAPSLLSCVPCVSSVSWLFSCGSSWLSSPSGKLSAWNCSLGRKIQHSRCLFSTNASETAEAWTLPCVRRRWAVLTALCILLMFSI